MNISTLILLLSLLSFCMSGIAQTNAQTKDPDFASFDLANMVSKLDESCRPWISVMQGENVLTGIYRLKAGAEDKQSPHDTDEVYYVVSGKGKFKAGEEVSEVKAGSILFVKAEVVHHFFEISEDLVMVVFFDK